MRQVSATASSQCARFLASSSPRYLDYCSELLALDQQARGGCMRSILYDPVILNAVNDMKR